MKTCVRWVCGRIEASVRGKVYKMVVRPALMYGLEMVALRKRHKAELEVAEVKISRFFIGNDQDRPD